MFAKLQPDKMVKTVFELSPAWMQEMGKDTILFDIDNTLVAHDVPAPTPEILDFLKNFTDAGIKVAFLSNNCRQRVDKFCSDLDIVFLFRAWKPLKMGFKRVLRRLGSNPESTVIAGDQMFTDIWGGNRMGCYTVLVTPIKPAETRLVAMKRRFEKNFLKNEKNY